MEINLNDLTVGDLEQIEDIAGVTAGQMFSGGGFSAKAIKAIVYVVHKKDDPSFTLDDAANVKFTDVGISDKADPTDAASS